MLVPMSCRLALVATTTAFAACGVSAAASSSAAGRLGSRQSCLGSPLIGPVTVTGVLAAYGSEACGVDTGSTLVLVRRLTDGHVLRSVSATGPIGAESHQTVGSVVVKRDGAVAWIGTGHSLGVSHALTEVWRADRHGTARLDSGVAIRVHSLRLTGSTLHWRHGATPRSAPLR